jgi:RNase P/RNase MRP subunit p29
VLAAQHLLDLARLDLLLELVEPAGELVVDGLALVQPLEEHSEVLGAPRKRRRERDVLFDAAAALERLLGLGLIFPEIRLTDPRLYARELIGRSCRVKDSSAEPKTASRVPDSAEPGLHG